MQHSARVRKMSTSSSSSAPLTETEESRRKLAFKVAISELKSLPSSRPEREAISNHVIQYALTAVSRESIKLYTTINDATINLVDKFFEMQRHDAIKALDIYRRAGKQVSRESIKLYTAVNDATINLVDKFFEMQRRDAIKALDIYRRVGKQFFEMQCHDAIKALDIYRRASKHAKKLSEFYEVCKCLDLGCGFKFPTLEQPPTSLIYAMEEYVQDAPRSSSIRRELV